MELFFYLVVFLTGTALGSFLNVVVDRSAVGMSYLTGRSRCEFCHKELKASELVPLFSFITQKGRCRSCKKKLSLYYPVMELATGAFFVVAAFHVFGWAPSVLINEISNVFYVLYFLYIVSVLLIIFFTDLKYGLIPFYITTTAMIIVFLVNSFFPISGDISLVNYLMSAFFSSAFFMLLFLLTKGRGMGFGDVIYVFLMGLLLGYPNVILGLYIAFLSGAVVALILVFLRKKKMKGGTIPFGPFLVAGTIISLFWGKFIIDKLLLFLVI